MYRPHNYSEEFSLKELIRGYLFFSCLLGVLLSSSLLSAAEYPYIYRGIRPMGMGGAFVGVSTDAHALFYNPAGLSYVPEKKLTLLSADIESSREGYTAYKDLTDIDTKNSQETTDFLRTYIGQNFHIAASSFIRYERPQFAFGIFGSSRYNLSAHNFQYPELSVGVIEDLGGGLGYAHGFFDNTLSLGASGKYLARRSYYHTYTLPEITSDDFYDKLKDDMKDYIDEGSGGLIDVGIMYRIPDIKMGDVQGTIQLGMSGNNLVGADLGDADDLKEHLDIGASLQVDTWIVAVDYIDLLQNFQDHDKAKRIRVGIEYTYSGFLSLRTGYYQGYPTFGVCLFGKYGQLDLLTYAEEMGTYSGHEKDRRYSLSFGLGF